MFQSPPVLLVFYFCFLLNTIFGSLPFTGSHEDQQRNAQRLQSEKEALQDRLDIAKKLLNEQVEKLKAQVSSL